MAPRKKSTRADSSHVQTAIMVDALRGTPVPDCVKLQAEDMPFWQIITQTRAEWSQVDLLHAANMARCMASIEKNQAALLVEGDVVVNAKGTQIMNPRFTVLEQLTRRSVSLSSKIQVHAAATLGEAKQSKGKNTAKRAALQAMEDVEEDDLIARPMVN